MKVSWIGVLVLAVAFQPGARADAPVRKQLEVNEGTRSKNRARGPIETVTVHFGPMPNSTAMGAVNISGPNLKPQCVIHTATMEGAMALAALIHSDKLVSISCIDEMETSPIVIIQWPPRPGNPADCPKGLGCSGQSVQIETKP